ncbi:hypothetical protein HanIR_Chr02g0091591 [Helianthus annuus]|nr:hypothetical protein HanIR_Chr02g0091591 [Helianthus annuus]
MTGTDSGSRLYDKYCKTGDKIKSKEILNDYLQFFFIYETLFEKLFSKRVS